MHQTSDGRCRDTQRAVIKVSNPWFALISVNGTIAVYSTPFAYPATLEAELDEMERNCKTCVYKSTVPLRTITVPVGPNLTKGQRPQQRWQNGAPAVRPCLQGPAGRATFIAADVREDGRERHFRLKACRWTWRWTACRTRYSALCGGLVVLER